jgi:cytochrome c553
MSSTTTLCGWRLAICFGFAALYLLLPTSQQARHLMPQNRVEDKCLACHKGAAGRAGEVVGLHLQSSHASLGCLDCHGGDSSTDDKVRAHGGKFVSKPDRAATLTMCGECHEAPLTQFKVSRHFPEKKNIPRLDCVECHGAHTVGNPPETFSFVGFCAGCHGLEYLPELPAPVLQLLAVSDDLRDSVRVAEFKKKTIPREFLDGRKQIRREISEVVHPTDVSRGAAKLPEILRRRDELKTLIK